MEATEEKKKVKGDFFKNLKIEFKKIIWPEKKSAAKQTIAVIVVCIILGVIVRYLDMGIMALIQLIS